MANIMKDKNFGETHRSLLLGIYVLFLFLCATFLKPLFICLFSCMIDHVHPPTNHHMEGLQGTVRDLDGRLPRGNPQLNIPRDENGAKTAGTVCYHIFFIFFVEANTNTETPEMNMKTDTNGNEQGANTERTQQGKRVLTGT